MELITFESKAYRELVHKIEKIADFVFQKESIPGTELPEVWLDSLELSQVLNVSTRTLQRLRKENLISYTMLRGKCLYKLGQRHSSVAGLTKDTPQSVAFPRKCINFAV